MNSPGRKRKLTILTLFAMSLLWACSGDDGAAGPPGPQGPPGVPGDPGDPAPAPDPVTAAIDAAKPESCATCHGGAGEGHQAVYDKYTDESAFEMIFTDFTVGPGGAANTFDGTLEFTILKDGLPFTDFAGLDDARFLVSEYNSAENDYQTGAFFWITMDIASVAMGADGDYTIDVNGLPFDPTVNGQVYGYIAQTPLFEHEGSAGSELPEGTHVHLYDDVANAALAFGDALVTSPNAYVSAANVGGCEKCHGMPYLKHGYRAAEVDGVLPDFAACKSCHLNERGGFAEDFQYMADEPFNWASDVAPTVDYGYRGNIMNNVHMSHAMEFPYPQSMQNCATCHGALTDATGAVIPGTDKLAMVLDDTQFTAETCLSCHPVQGIDAWPKTFDEQGNEVLDSRGRSIPGDYYQPNRAPALNYLWVNAGVDGFEFHNRDGSCQSCHGVRVADGGTGFASQFTDLHTGYDVNITDPNGVRYADAYTVDVDAIAYDGDTGLITVEFSASDPAIVPELYISFYGWDTKHFIVGAHERDANAACSGFRPGCQMEYVPESSGGDPNPIFTEDAASVPGAWKVTADPSLWQLTKTASIPEMIADGTIKRFEVSVAPELNLSDLAVPGPDLDVVLTAANKTFDIVADAIDDDYFKGPKATVSTAKCNVCHDALASSFHSESGRGGTGIEVCKNCHTTTFPGSHLEMASRSIDSYIHAIHSFQAFDVGDVFGDDEPDYDQVEAMRYQQHINHVFPNFTIRNCEACHVTAGAPVDPANPGAGTYPVVYNVPDQSKSMPGVLAASDSVATWYEMVDGVNLEKVAVEDPTGRNIGTVPEYVTGPASRACAGCHRARLINQDEAGALASLNAHTEAGGTLVENDSEGEVVFGVIEKIMTIFE